MNEPSVSVVIPVRDGARFLGAAIESVLAGHVRPHEIVVVDDGSHDGSAEVARGYPEVRCIVQPPGGTGAARNRGVAATDGDAIAFLDADDLWRPEKLARQLETLAGAPRTGIVYCHVEQFVTTASDDERQAPQARHRAMRGIAASTCLVRRAVFERVGDFSTAWRLGEFMEWHARSVDLGIPTIMLPDILVRRRVHGANFGLRERAAQSDLVHVLKATLDRRRGRGSDEGVR